MKNDEFAFFNQQLAAMLRDGIPLEGALRRLCEEMRRGELRTELQLLETDLAKGTPMADALAARPLPELYKRMILVGVKSGDLPGALTMLADYYQRQNSLWVRLKGLMVYPLIVLFVAFLVSVLFTILWSKIGATAFDSWQEPWTWKPTMARASFALLQHIWIFPTAFGFLLLCSLAIIFVPNLREKFRWRLPAFKEASVSRVAASLNLLLKGGVNLPDAIGLVQRLESNNAAATDLARWSRNIASGRARFSEVAADSRLFPPLFVWIVSNAGEDLAAGFQRASEIYSSRAAYRTEVALYSALPISVLFLGAIILSEAFVLVSSFSTLIQVME